LSLPFAEAILSKLGDRPMVPMVDLKPALLYFPSSTENKRLQIQGSSPEHVLQEILLYPQRLGIFNL